MPTKARNLVLTNNLSDLAKNGPIIFLEEWSMHGYAPEVLTDVDYIVATPFGVLHDEKVNSQILTRSLSQKLFPELVSALNELLGVDESFRYWRILLGHWFDRFIEFTYARYYTLKQCLNNYEISNILLIDSEFKGSVPKNTSNFYELTSSAAWNNQFFKKIIEDCGSINSLYNVKYQNSLKAELNIIKKNKRLNSTETIFYKFVNFFQDNRNSVVFNTYLGRINEIKLQMLLKQFPVIWKYNEFNSNVAVNSLLRSKLESKLLVFSNSEFENLVVKTVSNYIPICFLEDYFQLKEHIKSLKFPSQPKFVLNSGNFDGDEIFKFWVADKVKGGSKYFVGQHGNGYGTHRFFDPTNEELTADTFLTWGWALQNERHKPAIVFMPRKNFKAQKRNPLKIYLLCQSQTVRLSYWDDFFEFKESLRDLETLVEKMNHSLTRNLIVKGHPANNSSIINVTSYLRDKFPEIKFIESGIPIEKLYKFSKMFIHTYDSTAMIKTLYQNIPTLAFWRNDLSHVSFKFKSLYEELVSLGILHFSPLSLLSKLEILQNDIDYWWYSEDVQKARKNFLNSLANNPRSPIRSLRKILLEK